MTHLRIGLLLIGSLLIGVLILVALFFSFTSDNSPDSELTLMGESDFNFDWRFSLSDDASYSSPVLDDSAWEKIQLPHDWSIKLSFSQSLEGATGYLPGGIAWYRKQFETPVDPNKALVYLNFDGIYNHSEIWLNGNKIGGEVNGYTPFTLELNKFLKPKGEQNVIAVRVDRSRYVDSRWYTGSGIYRNVTLLTTNKLHIPLWGTYITTPAITAEQARVDIELELKNSDEKRQQFDLETTILAPDGSELAKTSTNAALEPETAKTFTQSIDVVDPILWDIATPNLYLAKTIVKSDGKVLQEKLTRFGFRTLKFDPKKGFFLNGKQVKIKGVNIHHAAGLVGAAVPKDVWRRRLLTLREAGTNAIRMAHNPSSAELLDLCDELGFLVQAEIFDEWDNPKDKRLNQHERHNDYISRGYADYFQTHAEKDSKATVKRDRNHPSVIMWSIGNEIEWTYSRYAAATGYFDMNAAGNYFYHPPFISPEEIYQRFHTSKEEKYVLAKTAKKLSTWVKQVDKTRPVTANLILPSVSHISGYTDALDIIGYSYRRVIYDYGHRLFPEKMLLGSENVVQWHEWKAVGEREFVAGTFLWTGIDYLGESHDSWPKKATRSGMLDLAGFKKPSFHMMKTLWNKAPHVYLTSQLLEKSPYVLADSGKVVEKEAGGWETKTWSWHDVNRHWNYQPGKKIVVEVYSNCAEVELFLNNQSLGKQALADHEDRIFKWSAAWQGGLLDARGLNGCNASDQLVTAAEAKHTQLKMDRQKLRADAYQVAHLEIQLVDDKNQVVRHEERYVEIEVPQGITLLGVDNGTHDSVQNYHESSLQTHNGRALAIVKATSPGTKIITVSGEGLQQRSVEIQVSN